ncbi:TfoX/Sxy family protein [Nitratireductor sp. ZSWI3]|uniref:TfoX/Sxy family protein n=1 Tax=Nitratireductor sp. ZSWI3 TaxID=2966359 RepID=UPI00214FD363|nr:TfoX/Sxy family protein [Nitratireductor sp. ZSWI3]MCR4266501.1 TfoX/Sxy family protein [Nitratireductor sp. ZSWI3]
MDDDAIRDLFASLGPVTIRRMFGGKGIYHRGVVFALEVGGEILLKADAQTAALFAEAGSRQWVYEGQKGRGPVAMPYWSIPDPAIDDPDEMALWALRAFEAGMRSGKK